MALSRDLARDTLNSLPLRAPRGVADLANPGWEEQERHKAERALMSANYLLIRFIFERRRPDQAPDVRPTTIFDGGRIRQYGLAKELQTE
jgi:hypothetical protein